MEIIFLLIAIILSALFVYGLGRLFYTHSQIINVYKTEKDIADFHAVMLLMASFGIFIVLVGLNNTFWKLPYLFW